MILHLIDIKEEHCRQINQLKFVQNDVTSMYLSLLPSISLNPNFEFEFFKTVFIY